MKPELWTIKEVAERLRVSSSLVYRLINNGELKCHRIQSAIRISEEHILEYLADTEVEVSPPLVSAKRHF